MGVCYTQGYIVQPPNLRFFGHSSLTLSKYGGGVAMYKGLPNAPALHITTFAQHPRLKGT